jgi:NTP pyrophosphatase (non-canonical NTP hydrolase)
MGNDSLARLTNLFLNFRDARDWKQFHNPKELAVSLVVESAEFLELFQWKTGAELDRVVRNRRDDLADELADVLHSLLLLAHDLDIDLPAAAERKIQKMERKYPVDKAKGKPRKYDDLE